MRKFIIDFEFNEVTGATRILVDFNDDSMSSVEINDAIRSGELLEEVLKQTAGVFGNTIAEQVRSGKIAAVCLDHHPELRSNESGILINAQTQQKRELKQ
ncbi:MAG: hypothetical protein HQM10_03410 [Candidatus Riflebacteria bacterium]|nr:hypothetical protein [Candidatus Riflebacteria bacterium]